MAQYKTIAGPIGLKAGNDQSYEDAVKKYAAIIDAEAVGGWELHWIQQIPVTKITTNVGNALCIAMAGGLLGFFIGMNERGANPVIIGVVLGIIGGIFGASICKNEITEFFNMLVFSKKD